MILDVIETKKDVPGKYLRPKTIVLRVRYPNGKLSKEMPFDMFERARQDAAVIVPLFFKAGEPHIILRSSLRPALYDRFGPEHGNLWELPAGMIDSGETPAQAAARELLEEVGLTVQVADLVALQWCFSSTGTHPEKLHFFGCLVDPDSRQKPETDGSPLEEEAEFLFISVDEFLKACSDGEFHDMKSEMGVRRFMDYLRGS